MKNLQFYLRLGLKLKKHCVLDFNQSQWLKPYVEFNIQKRIEAEKNDDKDWKALCKLMLCGKTMENMRKRINRRLVGNEKTI